MIGANKRISVMKTAILVLAVLASFAAPAAAAKFAPGPLPSTSTQCTTTCSADGLTCTTRCN